MSEIRDRLRIELARAVRVHGELTTDAVADALAAVIPTPTWAATVRPGDTLVLGFANDYMTPDDLDRARSVFTQACPDVGVIVVAGVESMAVKPVLLDVSREPQQHPRDEGGRYVQGGEQ